MDDTMLAWLLGVAAFVAAALAWWPWVRAYVPASVFADYIVRMIENDNLSRAPKLIAALPHALVPRAIGRVLELDDPTRDQMVAAYNDELRAGLKQVGRLLVLVPVALAAAGVCAYFVFARGATPLALIGPGVALILIVHARFVASRIVVDGFVAADRIFTAYTPRA